MPLRLHLTRANKSAWLIGPPEKPGVYVLQAHLSEHNGLLRSQQRTFIKVTPKLSSGRIRTLLIGQKKYSLPIARMTEGMGLDVDVIDEDTIHNLAILRDPADLRGKYDLVGWPLSIRCGSCSTREKRRDLSKQ